MSSCQKEKQKKEIVAVSKSLPKMLQDLATSDQKNPGKVRIFVNKQGDTLSTTLGIKPQKRRQKNERKRL